MQTFVQPTVGITGIFSMGGLLIGFLNTGAIDQGTKKNKQVGGGILERREFCCKVESQGAATAWSAIAIRAKNPLADRSCVTLKVLFVNIPMGNKLITFRAFFTFEYILMAFQRHRKQIEATHILKKIMLHAGYFNHEKNALQKYSEIVHRNLYPQITVIGLCWLYDEKKDEKQGFVGL